MLDLQREPVEDQSIARAITDVPKGKICQDCCLLFIMI